MGRRIPAEPVRYGRNASTPLYDENRYIKCDHCGFICHLDRDARARRGSKEGDGVSYPDTVTYDEADVTYDGTDSEWDGGTVSYDGRRNDLSVDRGCPLCGCLLYYEDKY